MSYEELIGLSDEWLCTAAQGGDRGAANVLAERYFSMVRAAARPYFLAGGDSEDLIQEGMLGLLSAIREYDGGRGKFSTFATSCVKNRIISSARAAGREKNRPLRDYLPLDDPNLSEEHLRSPERDPAELLDERESYLERLREYESALSPFENRVLGLYLEGLATAEIAERVGKPRKSVENAIARIRRKLQQ